VDRCEPRRIEGGLAARAVERLMGEIAHFIDKETDLPHADQMVCAESWWKVQLAGYQSQKQRLITRLFGAAADRRGLGHGPN
jgi:hypothetical protein